MKKKTANLNTGDTGSFDDLLAAVGEKKDRKAFIALFEYYAPRIKSFLLKGGITPEQADELAQETMLTVWNKAATYNPDKSAASTWIFTIARNKRIDFLRKGQISSRAEVDIEDPALIADSSAESEESRISHAEEAKVLKRALKELPDEQAELIKKSYFENKTHREIAKETDLPLGTVKSRIRLALERLRYHLGDMER